MAIPRSDLTAAARIRDAALRLFAERGVAGTSIRDVARVAGVSAGLVQHHFRSKARLRRAVEEFVTRRATESFGRPIGGDSPSESSTRIGARISAFIRENPAAFTYIGRSLLEADAAALELLDRLLVLARAQLERLVAAGLLRPDVDLEWTALHVILIDVGAYLLEPALGRYLGESLLGEKGLKRMERATEALFLKGIYRLQGRRRGRKKH
jgi:TetR/AcrR family transcriptional regulator, regulator of cefoperazone and chloramphenicol sensitivity